MSTSTIENFSFQYFIDLGNQKISNIFINQDSDPYVEASKFCAKLSLPSIIVTILGDAIKQQIQEQKDLISNQRVKKLIKGGLQERDNRQIPSLFDTMNTQLKEQTTQFQQIHAQYQPYPHKAHLNQRSNVFQNLYNRHKIIEHKKEISRKKSFQSIPFRPKINHLSQKIVRQRRKRSQSQPLQEKNILKEVHTNNHQNNQEFIVYHSIQNKTIFDNSINKSVKGKSKKKDKNNVQNDIFQRSEINRKKNDEKRKKIRNNIQAKLMQNCSFRPTINSKRNLIM